MVGVPRELTHEELDQHGVHPGQISDRMTEYYKMQGVKEAQSKLTTEDREHARDIKNYLYRFYNPYSYGYGNYGGEGK